MLHHSQSYSGVILVVMFLPPSPSAQADKILPSTPDLGGLQDQVYMMSPPLTPGPTPARERAETIETISCQEGAVCSFSAICIPPFPFPQLEKNT